MSNGQTVRQHDTAAYGVDPYTVPCPLCEAKVGELCSSELGGKRNAEPHTVRILAARELEKGTAE